MRKAYMAIIVFVLVFFCFAAIPAARALDENVTLGWEQDLTVQVAKWELFEVTGAAAPFTYTKIKDIPFTAPAALYTTPYTFVWPNGKLTTKRLTMRAVGTFGQTSAYCDELVQTRDLRDVLPPSGLRVVSKP